MVLDERLQEFVNSEAIQILRVSENSHRVAFYQVHLAKFPRKDILGLSVGKHKIFVNYDLTRLAYRSEHHRWLLRQTLAHEIAHDVLGGDVEKQKAVSRPALGLVNRITGRDLGLSGNVSFFPYSTAAELEADSKGIQYWQRLGWDCRIWARIFQNFLDQGYYGDVDHPTTERLNQARKICPANTSPERKKPSAREENVSVLSK